MMIAVFFAKYPAGKWHSCLIWSVFPPYLTTPATSFCDTGYFCHNRHQCDFKTHWVTYVTSSQPQITSVVSDIQHTRAIPQRGLGHQCSIISVVSEAIQNREEAEILCNLSYCIMWLFIVLSWYVQEMNCKKSYQHITIKIYHLFILSRNLFTRWGASWSTLVFSDPFGSSGNTSLTS